jgi:hypothetical protein
MNRANHHRRTEPSFFGISILHPDGVVSLTALDTINLRIVTGVSLPSHGGHDNHIGGKVNVWTRGSRIQKHISLVPEVAKVGLIGDDPIPDLAIATILHLENRGEGNVAV